MKPGYPIFVVNCQTAEVGTGTVVNVGKPHVTNDKNKLAKGNLMMVVDVTTTIGNQTSMFELQDTASRTMSDDGLLLITPNKEDVINGIRMLQAQSEQALRLMTQHKEIKNKCISWLQENDPVLQQKAAYEKRLSEMQTMIDKQNAIINQQASDTKEMKEMLEKLLKK